MLREDQMQITLVKNVTTASSPVTYEVHVRLDVFDLREDPTTRQFLQQKLTTAVVNAIEGIA